MEWVSGNIFIRANPVEGALKKGHVVPGHKHKFDHTTIVFSGAVHVKATLPDGGVLERDFHAPSHFLVKADVVHEITALEDGTVFWCVYSHRSPQGDVVQEYTGFYDAYTTQPEEKK